MAIDVTLFPCLSDNYGLLVHDPDSGHTATIDTPDAGAINQALDAKGWTLTDIWNTHHHPDHVGGNLALKDRWGARVTGFGADAARIPGIDIEVAEGDRVLLGSAVAEVIEVPGHTRGHIAFYFADDATLFAGDTLFALGCGRLFEGTPEQMLASLSKLAALPAQTRVYCAHEYTEANARFALTVEPQNQALVERSRQIKALREAGEPTVPTTLALERATNPFLRWDSPDLRATLELSDASDVEVLAETRRRKDQF
ncbi:MAG: hydroxyacylglutathione hydrolase [Pseudomonadota bacterium]